MADFDDDELDLLGDDGDGIIETIVLLDEDEENQSQVRAGCLGLMAFIALPASLIYFGLSLLQV